MNFFFDENFPKLAVNLIPKDESDIFDIRGSENEGLNDKQIFELAQNRKAVFCTTDKDFLTQIHFPGKPHFGIMIIALSQPNSKSILNRFNWFLEKYSTSDVNNKCFYLTDNNCKIYE